MSDVNESLVADQPVIDAEPNPEDFNAWNDWRDKGGVAANEEEVTPAVGEKEPSSEPLEETPESQTAAESEPEEEAEQVETTEPTDPEEPVPAKPKTGLSKRMRELAGEIKALKSQLAELRPDVEEEAAAEVVSAPEPMAEAEAAAPKLSDFEDLEDGTSSWDQYEAATRAFNKAETAKAIAAALTEQRQTLESEHAKAVADADWNKASERFTDYDAVVKNDAIQVSPAMISVMRMDPEAGTELAYHFGQHPEDAARILKVTLANNEKDWQTALARAGMELGAIRAKLSPPAKNAPKAVDPKPAVKVAPPAPIPPTPTKKLTTASKPPPILRGNTVAPKTEDNGADYEAWNRGRIAELARTGKR